MGVGKGERSLIEGEVAKLEEKLGIEILPREYVFLNKIRDSMGLGKRPDLKAMALQSGYGVREAENPEMSILRNVDPKLMSEVLGFNRGDVERELVKIMKQDEDLSAKIRAIEIAAKVTGMMQQEGTKIQINSGFTGFKLGD